MVQNTLFKNALFDYQAPVAPIAAQARHQARARQLQLTKPPGSLGYLEELAVQFAGWQSKEIPVLDGITVRVFAGDHGVCGQGVSAFPQLVTQQMIHNFCSGGAAVSVLSARQANQYKKWDFQVWNMGTIEPMPVIDGLVNKQICAGTRDFSQESSMTEAELQACMQAGAESVCQTREEPIQLFIGGEMGIGNTTSAAALFAALYGLTAEDVVGRGTGVDDDGLTRKKEAIKQALIMHTNDTPLPIELLQRLGGLEIAALTGAYIRAAQLGIPSLVDGFIATAAAAYAIALNPEVKDWLLFGHCSAEQAHRSLLDHLGVKPILQLDMRLGEGSGAVVAVPVIQLALALHANMATFADAGVSEADG